MKKIAKFLLSAVNTRLGFILTLVFIYWLKTIWAYNVDFSLDLDKSYQFFLTLINPIPISLLLLGLDFISKIHASFISLRLLFILYLIFFSLLILFTFENFQTF